MAQHRAEEFAVLDQRLALVDRLALIHKRLCLDAPSVARISFVLYHQSRDLLCTYVSHPLLATSPAFHEKKLADVPSLQQLAQARCSRVIHDLAAELSKGSDHSRWLLSQGWQSSYTMPLYWGDGLLGFLFLDSLELATFRPMLLNRIQVSLELLAAVLIHEVSQLQHLRCLLRILSLLVDHQDPLAYAHVERVSLYSRLIAIGLAGSMDLSPDFVEDLYLFSALRGLAKWSIPVPHWLPGAGTLAPQDRRDQPQLVTGIELLNRLIIGLRLAGNPRIEMLRHLLAQTPELIDGMGDPDGMRADRLPLEARIVAVADVYDALMQTAESDPPLSGDGVEAILRQAAEAGRIDGQCLEVLLAAREQRQAIQLSTPEF